MFTCIFSTVQSVNAQLPLAVFSTTFVMGSPSTQMPAAAALISRLWQSQSRGTRMLKSFWVDFPTPSLHLLSPASISNVEPRCRTTMLLPPLLSSLTVTVSWSAG